MKKSWHYQFGGRRPGERSHWFMREAVSACLARRRSNSRDMLPGGSFWAASVNFCASSANRSSNVRTPFLFVSWRPLSVVLMLNYP
jgi:hypothetical protein